MKDDLISRSALDLELQSLVKEYNRNCESDKSSGAFEALYRLRLAPAVDAETVIKSLPYVKEALEMAKQSLAPVVRCKDCEHMKVVGHGFRWCVAWERIQTMGDDGFCNFGERRVDHDQA